MGVREVKWGLGIAAGSLAVLLTRFLVPSPIGLADNGDGIRLLCNLDGLDNPRPLETYVRFAYWPAPRCVDGYRSSQLWLDRVAQALGHALGGSAALDLIVLGVLSCVLAAIAVAVLVLALPLRPWHRAPAAVAVLLVVADSAFFGYFASVFSEFAAFLGLLLMVGGLLLMRRAGRTYYAGGVVTLAGAVLGINAKAQTLLILPVLLLALCFTAKPTQPTEPAEPGRPAEPARPGRRRLAAWLLPAVVAVGAVTATATAEVATDTSGGLREMNMYHAIFHSIADGAHDTGRDLADLGLPPSFVVYAGSTWWTPVRATQDPAYPRYEALISRRNVAHYYLTHPVRTAQILQQAGTDLLTARPDYLASFGERSGLPPRTKEYRVPVISGLTGWLAPLGLFVLIPWWLLLGGAGLRAVRGRSARGRVARGRSTRGGVSRHPELGLVVCFLVLTAVTQFGTAALGEGIEGVKHQTIALFCTVLASVLGALMLLPRADFPAAPAVADRGEPARSPGSQTPTGPATSVV